MDRISVGIAVGMSAGMLLGAGMVLVVGWIANERAIRECAQARDVFRCERVVSFVSTQGETP